jgi:hypothetical protein
MSIDAKTARSWYACIPPIGTDADYPTPSLPFAWAIPNIIIGKKNIESAPLGKGDGYFHLPRIGF